MNPFGWFSVRDWLIMVSPMVVGLTVMLFIAANP